MIGIKIIRHPADFKPHPKEFFDTKEMQRLFKRGYDDAVNGYKWHKTPPGYGAEDEREDRRDENSGL